MTGGELLKLAREQAALTQTQVAKRAGTKQSAVSRIERGLVSPSIETLSRLIEATGHTLVLSIRKGPK